MTEKLSAQPWHDEIKRYNEQFKKWTERGESIVKRYRDERKESSKGESRFNILWSNVRTLKPAIYAKPPMPEVSRRYNDNDPVARCASTILERALDYEIKQYGDFNATLSCVVEDRLLPGRGVAWIRYEPTIETIENEPFLSNYIEADGEEYATHETSNENQIAGENSEPLERIENEQSPVDYVYWQDFAHLPARTWDEVTWVARRVYMSKEEGLERFGEEFENVTLTTSPDKKDDEKSTTNELKKAEVWEIWDKPKKCVYWVAAHHETILDKREDPLELENFFPCPKPFFATISTGSLIPVADFVMYQDQANEIDEITGRIQHLTRALKVMGIYAADEPSIERLMKEGNDAVMIPVKNWQAFAEKGGLSNAVQFIPLNDVIQAIAQLYQAREACKQIIYEITGLSDIVRGATNANETATAQQLKSNFQSLRLNEAKDDMSRFARDVLRMKAEVMCSKYQPETLIKASGIMHTSDAELVQQAIMLLKNEPMRNFNIDIETDTLVLIDKQQDKQDRIEFLTAVSGFMRESMSAGKDNPQMIPLLGELLMFGIRGFKIGRTVEASFEKFIEQSQQQAANPQPTSEQQKMEFEKQKLQSEIQVQNQQAQQVMAEAQSRQQLEAQRFQNDAAIEAQKMQVEQAKIQLEKDLKERELQFEQWKTQLENNTKIMLAEISAKSQMEQKSFDASREDSKVVEENQNHVSIATLIDAANQNMAQMLQSISEQYDANNSRHIALLEQHSKPRRIVRDENGKVLGIE
jgi:hypothetical protein